MSQYTPTIGLEIHAELKTKTKMFCDSKNAPHDSEPNTHVCPICMGHPGTLPTINKEAIRHMLLIGKAVEGTTASFTEFDRKNYFYPDIPKGYQISQYEYPLVRGGTLAGVAITRVHLEEDTARSQHDVGTESLIDYNRAGVPLMELVTEPVMHDAETAGAFARELQLLLRTLGVSDANMERGEMRVEANVSVSKDPDELGTKVEVKNLNSFKAVEAAIRYETKRQTEALEKGEELVQETRGWNENTGKTFSQRKKESSHDYRYFPDPDLPKLDISRMDEFNESRLNEIMPELPDNKRSRYEKLGIPRNQVEVLVADIPTAHFFDAVIDRCAGAAELTAMSANYTTSDLLGYIATMPELTVEKASPEHFVALMTLLAEGSIGSRVAKDLLPEVVFERQDPRALAEERNLLQASSEEDLVPIVDQIIREHTNVVEEYKAGKTSAMQFLVGQGMRISKGSANPAVLKKVLAERIG